MLEGQEPRPCLRCDDGSMRSGGFVSLPITPEPPDRVTRDGEGGVVYRVEECLLCGATELSRHRG